MLINVKATVQQQKLQPFGHTVWALKLTAAQMERLHRSLASTDGRATPISGTSTHLIHTH